MMAILFIGKPTVLLQVEFETTRSLIASLFLYTLLAHSSKCSVIFNTEYLIAPSQAFGSNSGPMPFKPCIEMVASLNSGSLRTARSRTHPTHGRHVVHAHTHARERERDGDPFRLSH